MSAQISYPETTFRAPPGLVRIWINFLYQNQSEKENEIAKPASKASESWYIGGSFEGHHWLQHPRLQRAHHQHPQHQQHGHQAPGASHAHLQIFFGLKVEENRNVHRLTRSWQLRKLECVNPSSQLRRSLQDTTPANWSKKGIMERSWASIKAKRTNSLI